VEAADLANFNGETNSAALLIRRAAVTIEPPDQPPQKLAAVQALRAVAALMVLLYHLVNTAPFGWKTSDGSLHQSAALVSAIGFAGVDLFFVISGLVMTITCYDRLGQPGQWAPFLQRRAARIYPLYWLTTLGVLALCWAWPELAARDKFGWPTLLKSFLLWPQAEYPIVAVGWTLTYEMYFYLVFAGLLTLPRRWFLPLLAAWAFTTIGLFTQFRDPAHLLSADGHLSLPLAASPLALEFIAGCLIGFLVRQGRMPLPGLALAVGAAALLTVGCSIGLTMPERAQYGLIRAATSGGSAALIVYGAAGLDLRGRSAVPRSLVLLGDASYSIYLTHMYVLWLLAAVLSALPSAWNAGAWLNTLAGIAACTTAALVCHLLVERPLLQLSRRSLPPARYNRAATSHTE
jgi:peptidoglycan/LPS O-acetylase OafA/YrhL